MTLTVVESAPSVALNEARAPLNPDVETTAETLSARKDRVTSGVRSTFKHLRQEGGNLAPFRGFASTILLQLGFGVITMVGGTISGFIVGEKVGILAGVAIACVATAKWNMALTHLRIASPESNKIAANRNIIQRGKQILWAAVKPTVAALVFARLFQETFGVIIMSFVPQKGDEGFDRPYTVEFKDDGSRHIHYGKPGVWFYVTLVLFYVGYVALVLPAKAIILRMQASAMSAEDSTIVAVDNTFGVESAGNGRTLGFCEAAKTFSRDDIRAILLMGVKLIGLETIQLAVYGGIVYVAMLSIAGKVINNVIDAQMGALVRHGQL